MLALSSRSGHSAQAEAAAVAGRALLPAPARAREVGVRAARRRRSRSASSSSASAPARPASPTRSRTPSTSAAAAARRSAACRRRSPSTRTIATAWRNLATAYEQKQRTQDAVNALERYTTLRPKDPDALAELASQYGTLATNYSNDYSAAQQQMAEQESPASAFGPPSTTPFGKAFASSDGPPGPDLGRGRDPRGRQAADGVLELPGRPAERRERLPAARDPEPEGRDLADPARPGGSGRAGHTDGDQGPDGVPEARADRSARAAGEAGPEGAQGPGGCQRLGATAG